MSTTVRILLSVCRSISPGGVYPIATVAWASLSIVFEVVKNQRVTKQAIPDHYTEMILVLGGTLWSNMRNGPKISVLNLSRGLYGRARNEMA
ncbi:hypothetical protein F5146DRAFT_1125264 [Armillaria mellea]|nr:hypothetical protein F5146DRAFT_1125264 [Armillaria mellea]